MGDQKQRSGRKSNIYKTIRDKNIHTSVADQRMSAAQSSSPVLSASLSRIGLYEIPPLGPLLRTRDNATTDARKSERCDNFYASVCAPVHEMPFRQHFKSYAGRADNAISVYDVANRHIDNELFTFLETYEHSKGSDFHRSQIARKMLMFHNKCIDERTRAKQAGLSIEMLIKRLKTMRSDGFSTTDMMIEMFPQIPFLFLQKWIDKHIAVQINFGIFYNVWPLPNWDEDVRALLKDLLKAVVDDAKEHIGDENAEPMPEWFSALGTEEQQMKQRIDTLIEMEKQMHEDDQSIEENNIDTIELSLGELRSEFPNGFAVDWQKLFNAIVPDRNFTASSTVLLVAQKMNGRTERQTPLDVMAEYMRNFGPKNDTLNKWEQYVEWLLILQHAALSDNKIFHRIFRRHPRSANAMMSALLVNKYFFERHDDEQYIRDGTSEERRVAQIRHNCLEQLKHFFPEYVDRMFALGLNDAIEEEAKTVLDNVKTAFAEVLDQTEWLRNETDKAKAKEKLAKMSNFIGKAPAIGNPKDPEDADLARIDERYAPYYQFDDSIPYVEIVRSLMRQWRIVDLANPAQFYGMGVHEVNGYNIYHWNSMQVTGGMLRPPFIASNQSLAQNFGSVGFIIGHELGHSFDSYGYEYNADGVKDEKWWSKASKNSFVKRKKCFMDQYSAYKMTFEGNGLSVNGTHTVFENIADNVGIRASFAALKARLAKLSTNKRRREEKKAQEQMQIEEEKLSNEQLFFLSYAYSWCGRTTRERMAKYVKRDPHAPREVRVNLALANFPEFASAFGCASGTPMNPEKRCTLWGKQSAESGAEQKKKKRSRS
ncbi:hypothetical protein niasHT_021383 [Heterodera trifolii]|uniref:Uncharacterized protein n=1 Tax=Heterodera trifolii TaxID=157864 RepID=A0ABD2K6X2_9BILA